MLLSELYKIMLNKVNFVSFVVAIARNAPTGTPPALKCLPIFRSFVEAAMNIHHTELGTTVCKYRFLQIKFFKNTTLCLPYQAWLATAMCREWKGVD